MLLSGEGLSQRSDCQMVWTSTDGYVHSMLCFSFDDLKTYQSIAGDQHSKLRDVGRQKVTALKRIETNTNFKKTVFLEEQKAQQARRLLRGRQIALHDLRVLP